MNEGEKERTKEGGKEGKKKEDDRDVKEKR
jgi:hypothetical protein